MNEQLNDNHWRSESYRQRMLLKDWRRILLNDDDHIMFAGHMRQLKAKSVGAGVYDVYKEPVKDE